MTHLMASKTRAEATPAPWLKAGVKIADFVNDRARRSDIVSYVGPGAGQGSAACFIPGLAEIELNVDIAFGAVTHPEDIGSFMDRATLFEWTKAAGALIHEASHARWTIDGLEFLGEVAKKDGNTKVSGVMEFMEEPRIEALAVKEWPRDVPFLRSSAMEIVMADLDISLIPERAPYDLSRLCLLTLARQDAGVLEPADTADLWDAMTVFFGLELLAKFRVLWNRVFEIHDHENAFHIMEPIAREWVALLPPEPELTEEQKDILEQIMGMLEEAAESAEVGGSDDAGDQEEAERWEAAAAAAGEQAKDKQKNEKAAERVFGKGTEDIPDSDTASRITSHRPPTDEERAAAVQIARDLERARYSDRISTEVKTMVPPGRLATRDAIQGVAQRSRGQQVTATPWARTIRKHVEDPNLTIGCMVDISGSMRSAMEPMAVTAWVMAEAGYRIQAQVAQVYFGNSAFPTLKTGQRMKEVVVRSAADGTEKFTEAFRALDGELMLTQGSGARLLIICSDMCYVSHEADACTKLVTKAVNAGVGVLVMPCSDRHTDIEYRELPPQVQVILGRLSPADTARSIGQAAIKALEAAGNRR